MGPLSDIIGRRAGLILCSIITMIGALLSTFSWDENALIVARTANMFMSNLTAKFEIQR